jgi:hypothetical protein
MAYSEQTKSRAKAMALAYGSAGHAHHVWLELDAETAPSERSIQLWVQDPSVEPDDDFLRAFAAETRVALTGSVRRLVGPLEQRLQRAIADGTALDVLNLTKAWGITVDKLRGGKDASLAPASPPWPVRVMAAYGPAPLPPGYRGPAYIEAATAEPAGE